MTLKQLMTGCLLLACTCHAAAERTYKYRVALRDKATAAYTVDRPEAFLSPRALERRARQGLPVDETDLPVCSSYLEGLAATGARIVVTSKWNNTAVVELADTTLRSRIEALPFVAGTQLVWVSPDSIPARNAARRNEVTNRVERTDTLYGDALRQIAVHHGDSLHAAGFRGEGIHIAVIDAGFYNADAIGFFRDLRLLGTRDFANPHSDIYAENSHGMMVLSCLAANTPGALVGTAPDASYWLLRSEDNDTEQPVEEDYWAAAIEFADSVGVDVVNTSLGYYAFDGGNGDYRYCDLDGHRSLMSNSASMAADKGMVVVCSAGNSGSAAWKKLTPPADAEGVITVGAMNREAVNAAFSSVGNTADGRIKPDVMAVGVASAVSGTDGTVAHANGTSFASPTFCGLVACLWQACPHLTASQLVNAVQRAGDRADCPDNIYGYGVADMWKAYLDNRR